LAGRCIDGCSISRHLEHALERASLHRQRDQMIAVDVALA
jgi:hypothetical protein